ncbi:MAG: TetR/AcrR family transcriptional regulator [Actinomycetota bacterium]
MSPAPAHPLEEARIRVLAAADDRFYECGVAAVTVAEIRDTAGVSLRRLYGLFPTKADLVAAWLRDRHTTWLAWFANAVGEHIRAGSHPTDAVFDAVGDWLASTDFRGCAFLNTLAETASLTEEHRAIIAAHKGALADTLTDFAADPDAVAVLLDGAIVRSAALRSPEPIEAALRAARQLAPLTGAP